MRRSRPAINISAPSCKPSRSRSSSANSPGLKIVIARPVGIYGPGDTRFLKMFRGIARGWFPILGSGKIFYHLTYVDDVVEGLRLCGETPAAAGRIYLFAGPRYTTLADLFDLMAKGLNVRPPRLRLPIWPVWLAGALCEAVCVPLRLEPPLYRRRVDLFRKSRAFDTTRARRELRWEPRVDLDAGIRRTIAVVPRARPVVKRLNIVQICDHLGWAGTRIHGVKRLFAWMIPRFDTRALQCLADQPAETGFVARHPRDHRVFR